MNSLELFTFYVGVRCLMQSGNVWICTALTVSHW